MNPQAAALLEALRENLTADRAMDGEPLDLARQQQAAREAAKLDRQLRALPGFDHRLLLDGLADEQPAMRLYAAQSLLAAVPQVATAASIRVLQDFATGRYGHGSMSIDAKETLRVVAKRLRA